MNRSVDICCSASPFCTFTDLFITCKGACHRRFHAVCVGIRGEDVPTISSSPNLFWFCDDCRDDVLLTFGRTAAVRPPESHPVVTDCGSTRCIFTDQLIRCDGPCGKDFHGMCVRLDRTDLAVIGSSMNIVWMCDDCKGDVRDDPDDLAEELVELEPDHQDVDDSVVVRLETKFESIIDKLTRLSSNLEQGVYTPPDSLLNSEGSSEAEDSQEMNDTIVESGATAEVGASEDNAVVESPVKDTNQVPKTPESSTKQVEPETDELPRKDLHQIFTFGSTKQSESSVTNLNFSFTKPIDCVEQFKNILEEQKLKPPKPKPVTPVEPQKDENNNSPKPEETIVPKVVELAPIQPLLVAKKVSSTFALWIKFDDPDLSSWGACSAIRQALGMSSHEPISARNVVPGHIRLTGQASWASFKVDMDAFWRKKALDGATWKQVPDYMEHAEWIGRR